MFTNAPKRLLTFAISKNLPTVCLSSTAAQPLSDNRLSIFRTTENDPAKHTSNHLAQFYKFTPEVESRIFQHGGITKSFKTQAKTFHETCIMVREPALDIIDCLKTVNYSKPPVKFVLYGKKGCGKSLTLAHIIHYAYNNKYLIVHVPWVGNWMRRPKEFSNSETKEGFVNINLDAAAWLLHFKTQNIELLKDPELTIDEDAVWSKREKTEKGATLLELIEHGISRIKYASDTINVLAEQVKRLSNKGKCKTLVAIDGYNALFYPNTRVYTEKKEMVPPSRVTLTEGFLNLTKFDWKNAAIVVTVDELAIAEKDHISHLPKYLLGKSGFEHIDPFVPVHVPSYSQKELTSIMEYYRERKWVQSYPGMDDELNTLSGGNPYKLMQLCAPL